MTISNCLTNLKSIIESQDNIEQLNNETNISDINRFYKKLNKNKYQDILDNFKINDNDNLIVKSFLYCPWSMKNSIINFDDECKIESESENNYIIYIIIGLL